MKYLHLALVFIFLSSCETTELPPLQSENAIALQRACQYLGQKQASDGGWRSETTGIMRGGTSLSPFIFWALLNIPDSIYALSPKQKKSGLQFIRQHINNQGVSVNNDPEVMDYPNYASAYSAMILHRFGKTDSDKLLVKKTTNYLKNQQFTEQRGIDSTHLAYGAWGFGETGLEKGDFGHIDISHTRRILQCLKVCEEASPDVCQKAQHYLLLSQKSPLDKRFQPDSIKPNPSFYDGGFYYSTIATGSNKGGTNTEGVFRSYATATCDGLLGVLAANFPTEIPQKAAIQWLNQHPNIHFPQGVDAKNPNNWEQGLVFYHFAVRAEAYRAIHQKGYWTNEISCALRKKQNADGHFMNPHGNINKENDPLLATALAVIALFNCL